MQDTVSKTEQTEISAVVLVYGEEVLLMTEPDRLPTNHAPYRVVGTLTSREGKLCVTPVTEDRDSNMLILGATLGHFAAHVERVKSQGQTGDSLAWLERLHTLEGGEGR
jgi:hypothetical protein